MSEEVINGIDVSECPLFYDHKIGCYHTFNGECVKDSCALYKWLLEYKRLQEENKRLNQELDIKEKMLDKFMIGSGETLEKLQKENEKLKTENEQLKKPCLVMPKLNQLAVPIDKYVKLYEAFEKIRKICKMDCRDCQYKQDCDSINEALNEQK